jgi:uncharacterized protein YqeY
MELKLQLESDLKDAMRASDDLRKRTLRMVISSIKNTEIDRQSSLTDVEVSAIMQKEIKSRREAIAEAEKANRPDLSQSAQDEIAVLEAYLPKSMSEDEIKTVAAAVIQELNAASPSDMGKVMKTLLPRLQGRAPGDIVSKIVRDLLKQ